ncbi:tripartite tricarboxylate transporter TctB family protein [Phyllobacterium leguminum]|uniref:Tripartite tricarboxylate transporter TctB family protein n=2 Tax=Phyllobacterium leguminum TaxID=314237 RepID=A0A318T8M9_9HYPH|nr:tripartite tricarboxylate transporter TctB family protein [Phyllobacterium leguminum]
MPEDRVIGTVLAILGVAMTAYSMTIPAPFASSGDLGPAVLPQLLGILMTILGLLLALRKPRTQPGEATEESLPADEQVVRIAAPSRNRQILLGVALVAFIALFDKLGFTLSAVLFLMATMALLGPFTRAHLMRAGGLSLSVALALGYILNGLLGLTIPGVWIG